MRNEQIIFNARMDLMGKGVIGTTGRNLEIQKKDGVKETVPEPEEIHTYAGWRELGFQVMRGQKAVASFKIWKHVIQKKKDNEEEGERMFLTEAYFFSEGQVEKMKKLEN